MSEDSNKTSHNPIQSAKILNYPVLDETTTEAALRTLAKSRNKFSKIELGKLAATGVRDIFIEARSETTDWKVPSLDMRALYAIPAAGMPLLGFGVSLGIDYAIFGGASKDLPLSMAFGFGSLVFGTGLGYVPKELKGYVMAGLLTASAIASFVAADNNNYRHHITATISNAFDTGSDAAQKIADKAHHAYEAALKTQATDHATYTHNDAVDPITKMPMDMSNDHNPFNDADGKKLLNVTLPEDQNAVDRTYAAWQNANDDVTKAKRKDPVELIGRGIVALNMLAWLAVSQLFVSAVVAMAPGKFAEYRQKSAEKRKKSVLLKQGKAFVKALQSADPEQRRNNVTAAVSDMLVKRFNVILTEAAKDNFERLKNVESLFEDDSLNEMIQIGVKTFYETLIPKERPPVLDLVKIMIDAATAKRSKTTIDTSSSEPIELSKVSASDAKAPFDLSVDRYVEDYGNGKGCDDPRYQVFYMDNAAAIEKAFKAKLQAEGGASTVKYASRPNGGADVSQAPGLDGGPVA